MSINWSLPLYRMSHGAFSICGAALQFVLWGGFGAWRIYIYAFETALLGLTIGRNWNKGLCECACNLC